MSVVGISCVNVDDPTYPELPDYRASVRFIHVATDAPSPGAVTVDGSTIGTIGFGQATAYLNLPAGTRNMGFAGTTQPVLLGTDFEGSVLIHVLSGGNRFVYLHEGPRVGPKNNPDTVLVKFVHAALGSAPNITFKDSATGTALSANVAFLSAPGYRKIAPGDYTILAVSDGSYMATIDGSQEVPPVSGVLSAGTGTFTLTDSLTYSITITSDNSQGFYTAAHFHNARAGSNGPVVFPIDVSGQEITFRPATLTGAQEVPPVQTTASGTGIFTLRANAARDTFSLSYSISVTTDTLDTMFVAAHFHNADSGQSGPVVHPIITTPFRDTVIAGVWQFTDTALVRELLSRRIYVNFHSVMHPTGAIRAQVIPNPTSTNVFSGTWRTIPRDLKDSVVVGSIYVNFHTVAHPGGQIRGQLIVDPSGGHYGVASLPSTTFANGEMHTIVAIGSGLNLQLLRFSDRTAGAGKLASEGEIVRKQESAQQRDESQQIHTSPRKHEE